MNKNKKLYTILGIVGGIVVIVLAFVFWRISVRNGIITASNECDNAWSKVQSQYQRRLELIPNLVATVKGAAAHEQETLQGVTDARTGNTAAQQKAADAGEALLAADEAAKQSATPETLQNLDRQYSIYVNAVHEAYPDLKVNQNFMSLQDEIAGTENRIAVARDNYNDAVTEYNNKIMRFPGSMFAGDFEKKKTYEAQAGADIAPTVDFNK